MQFKIKHSILYFGVTKKKKYETKLMKLVTLLILSN